MAPSVSASRKDTPDALALAAGVPARGETIASWPSVLKTNPYQRLLYGQLASHGLQLARDPMFKIGWLLRMRRHVQILHFHWPEPFWRHETQIAPLRLPLSWVKLGLFATRLAVARALGYRVVWTVHQILPHEVTNERLDHAGARVLARLASLLLVHDEGTAATARAQLRRTAGKLEIVPHGSYVGVYPPGRGRAEVRDDLQIPQDSFVFLCFGDLRAYKEIDRLLQAFAALEREDARLVVAGSVADDVQGATVRAAVERDPRVVGELGFVPAERVAELYGAADAAVIARTDGGTSGSLILALSLGVPVVAAATPTNDEVAGPNCGWRFDPAIGAALTAALAEAVSSDESSSAAKRRAARARAEALSWPEIGARTARLMRGERGHQS